MSMFSRMMAVGCFGAAALLYSASAQSAVVTGRVLDENGDHPPAALVLAVSADDLQVLSSAQTTDGGFTLQVADGSDVYLVSICLSGQELNGYDLHGYTLGLERVAVGQGLMNRDIDVRTCYELILEGRHSDGSIIQLADLPDGSAAVDGRGEAVVDGFLTVDGTGERVDVPSICVPVGESRRLYLRYELPGAGRLNLPLDRDGIPFGGSIQGAEIVDLNEALARSQLARLDRLVDEITGQGEEVPSEFLSYPLWETIHTASALGAGARAARLDATAAEAVVTLENLLLWKAERDATIFRMGQLDVVVRDLAGSPIPGMTVEYQQLNHDFGFGIFEPLADAGQEIYDHLQEAGLNSVTAGYYWKEIEPQAGDVDWEYIDSHVGVLGLTNDGWRVKGHPLTWLSDLVMPEHLDGLGFAELKRVSVDHVSDVVDHYRGTVPIWDVSNEASGIAASGGLSRAQMDEYLVAVFAAARGADPGAQLVLNNHFDRFGHARVDEHLAGADVFFTLSVPAFVDRCLNVGVDFDIIGQQLYNGGAITVLADWGLGDIEAVSTYDLGFISDFLDDLASAGKPIHITEYSVPSAWDATSEAVGAGYWRQPWNEEVQAAYLDAFLRLTFAHPAVRSITWWNALDQRAVVAHGGLFRRDGTPKTALGILAARIAEWTTSGSATTGGDGQASLRGFAGDYELTITIGDVKHRFEAHIFEQADSPLTLIIDPYAVPLVRRAGGRRAP